MEIRKHATGRSGPAFGGLSRGVTGIMDGPGGHGIPNTVIDMGERGINIHTPFSKTGQEKDEKECIMPVFAGDVNVKGENSEAGGMPRSISPHMWTW